MSEKSSTMVDVVVARGHTVVGEPVGPLGATEYRAGQTVSVSESEVPRLLALGVIVDPRTQEEVPLADPPPIEGQPKLEAADEPEGPTVTRGGGRKR